MKRKTINASLHTINCGALGGDVDSITLYVGGYGGGTPTTFQLNFGGATSTNSTSTSQYPAQPFTFTFSPAVSCVGSTTLKFYNTVSNNANVAGAPTATSTQACTTCAGLPSEALYISLDGTPASPPPPPPPPAPAGTGGVGISISTASSTVIYDPSQTIFNGLILSILSMAFFAFYLRK